MWSWPTLKVTCDHFWITSVILTYFEGYRWSFWITDVILTYFEGYMCSFWMMNVNFQMIIDQSIKISLSNQIGWCSSTIFWMKLCIDDLDLLPKSLTASHLVSWILFSISFSSFFLCALKLSSLPYSLIMISFLWGVIEFHFLDDNFSVNQNITLKIRIFM